MAIYLVALFKPNNLISEKIKATYGEENHYEIDEKTYLISDKSLFVDGLALHLGLDGTNKSQLATESEPPTGAVFALRETLYQGYASKTLWEWLKRKEP